MQNRVDIKDFILSIENDFTVNKWKYGEHHLWPYIRIKLCFYLINLIEPQNVSTTNNVVNKRPIENPVIILKRKLKKVLCKIEYFVSFQLWYYQLKPKQRIFFGADSHRVNYKNYRYNRYFDVLIEKNNWVKDSVFFEYGFPEIKNQYHLDIINSFESALYRFLFFSRPKQKLINLDGYKAFLDFLNTQEGLENFVNQNSETKIIRWVNKNLSKKIAFFKKVLKRIKPNKIIILCYYTENLMSMLAASDELLITNSIEMQHGPQTDIHLSYGNWSKIPSEGYSALPKVYWCWDAYSANVINKWAKNNSTYRTKIIGNPWVNYWKTKSMTYKYDNYILYSLQPNPIKIEQLFSEKIIELIKHSHFLWMIRLHPRQLHKKEEIIIFLKNKGVFDKVNINEATNDPLPVLLSNAKLHVTHFSGTALEASYFNLKTVLINEIGLNSFPQLLENNLASYVDYKDNNFVKKINFLIQS